MRNERRKKKSQLFSRESPKFKLRRDDFVRLKKEEMVRNVPSYNLKKKTHPLAATGGAIPLMIRPTEEEPLPR